MSLKYVQTLTLYQAGAGNIIGATTVVLTSLADIYGNAITTLTPFGAKGYITLEPDTSNEEAASFTGVTVNANGTVSLTGVSTVLAQSPYTETSGLVRGHSGGTKVVVTDNVGFWNTFLNKQNNETIAGKYTFPNANRPTMDTDADSSTATDLVTVGQMSRQAISGAADASTSVKGIVQMATQTQTDNQTTTGGTGALLVSGPANQRSTKLSDWANDSGAANAYVIDPQIPIASYLLGQFFTFTVNHTNTGSSTLNVSSRGTKTITRIDGNVLVPGDLVSGQIVHVQYDGTNFQLLNPMPSLIPSGSMQMFAGASAPSGWLVCDGSAVSRTTYASLFAVLSTTYGAGDTTTTFNVPDMRGRVPVGVGTGTGGGAAGTGLPTGGTALTAVARAGWKGEETHVLTTTEMPSHTHGGVMTQSGSNAVGGGSGTSYGSTASTGSDGAHNNIQPIMGVNFIIKV